MLPGSFSVSQSQPLLGSVVKDFDALANPHEKLISGLRESGRNDFEL